MLESNRTAPLIDLDACAQERVHLIGRIQPHGLLFALSEPDLVVRQVTTNVAALLGLSADAVLGGSFEVILGAKQFETFRSWVRSGDPLATYSLRLPTAGHSLSVQCFTHRADDVLIVELELLEGAQALEPLDVDAHVRIPLARLEQAADIRELSELAAREIRKLTGFDRAMVYQFDETWVGQVIADDVRPELISYLGLRFPASDIPAQVRQLFLLNPLRTIADRAAHAVPIVPDIGPLTGRRLDLTRSLLRSAAPVHLEYLRNMDVESSMTISIIVKHELWGMIACHHAAPHRVDGTTRSVCQLIAQTLASQVTLRLDNLALQSQLRSHALLESYMAAVEASSAVGQADHFQSPRLLELFDADGLVSHIDGVFASQGTTLAEAVLLPIVGTLRSLATRGIASSDMLSAVDPTAAVHTSQLSGALYLGLAEGSGDYLLFSRRELVETTVWAGNPDKSLSTDRDGRLHPRASFAAWQATVRGRSRPWTGLELESARYLREQLIGLRETQRLLQSEERIRYLAHHDTLTGLMNRYSIQLQLDQCVKDAAAKHSSFAVLFIDLDKFKHFNDRLGHGAGDQILRIVAQRIQHQVRAEDFVGRLGGDEFIVILPGVRDQADILGTSSRLLHAIEASLTIEQDIYINITASIGLSQYPADGTSSEALVNHSDAAMYRVKRNGGNALEHYQADHGAAA